MPANGGTSRGGPLAEPLAHDVAPGTPGESGPGALPRPLWQAGDTALVEATLLAWGPGLLPPGPFGVSA